MICDEIKGNTRLQDHLKIILPTAEHKNFVVVIIVILRAITRNTEGSAIFGAG